MELRSPSPATEPDGYRKAPVEPFYLAFGRQVNFFRIARGMTQGHLARLIGTAHTTVSQIENGQFRVNLLTADKLCAALGTQIEILWPDRANLPLQAIPRQRARRVRNRNVT
jgi:DNA-binding XRE family transcriptional regulator